MFWGRWDTKVDEKWRIYLPRNYLEDFKNKVLLRENNDGCIIIEKVEVKKLKAKTENLSEIFIEEIKNNGRIKIPETLRSSNSFYFGKKITIVGKGNYLKILPRP